MEVSQFSSRITGGQNISATFDKPIDFLDRNFVTLHELVGNNEIPTPIAANIDFSGNIVTVDPSIDLKTGVEYSLKFSKGAIKTAAGETFPSGSTSSHALILQIVGANEFTTPIQNPSIPSGTFTPFVPIPTPPPTPPDKPSTVPSLDLPIPVPVQNSKPNQLPVSNPISAPPQHSEPSSSPEEQAIRTFDSQVEDYKIGKNSSDRIVISTSESSKSWALWGFAGNDTIIGGLQDDFLVGGDGNDVLTGGKGSDIFVLSETNKTIDRIKDFSPKQDAIGISSKLISANTGDNLAIAKFSDVKNKAAASKFFKAKDCEHYVIIDSIVNIKNLNSSAYGEKIRLAVDLTNNRILYDADGNWARGSIELCKLDGKTTFGAWSAANFSMGLELG